jgi:hypothetical protein
MLLVQGKKERRMRGMMRHPDKPRLAEIDKLGARRKTKEFPESVGHKDLATNEHK